MPIQPLNEGEASLVQDLVLPNGEDTYHVTYGVVNDTLVAVDMQGLCDDLRAAFVSELGTVLSSSYRVGTLRMVAKIGGVDLARITSGSTAGTGGAEPLPPNCALLVRKLTGLAGHAGIGSMYAPGFVSGDEVNQLGMIDSGDLATKQSAFDDWLTAVNGITGIDGLALLHRSTGDPADLITSLVLEAKVATQHRRFNSR